MKEVTGRDRLIRLYKMLKKVYPDLDILFIEHENIETCYIVNRDWSRHKVAFYDDGEQICDAIWQYGSYGYEENLLEFYDGVNEPEGYIKERRAFNLFKKTLDSYFKEEPNI